LQLYAGSGAGCRRAELRGLFTLHPLLEGQEVVDLHRLAEKEKAEAAAIATAAAAAAQEAAILEQKAELKAQKTQGMPYRAPGGRWGQFKRYSVWQVGPRGKGLALPCQAGGTPGASTALTVRWHPWASLGAGGLQHCAAASVRWLQSCGCRASCARHAGWLLARPSCEHTYCVERKTTEIVGMSEK